jgi:hypothetical protein
VAVQLDAAAATTKVQVGADATSDTPIAATEMARAPYEVISALRRRIRSAHAVASGAISAAGKSCATAISPAADAPLRW